MEFKDGSTGQNNTYNESNLGEGSQYISKVDNLTIINGHKESVQSPPPKGIYQHFITHDAVGVPHLISKARRHIVLHAAFYPKYGVDDQGEFVLRAMQQNPNLRLTAIFTDVSHVEWADEFARTLRTYFTAELFASQIEASKQLFAHCLKEFGPQRVHIYDTSRLPLFPIILIDDTIVVGHYAHSQVKPPHGLWFTIKHPKVSSMYENLLAGSAPDYETEEERAILRYVEELKL